MTTISINDAPTIATVASIVAGFCATALTFRLQRHLEELPNEEGPEHSWVAVADWLLIGSTTIALLLVLSPLLIFELPSVRLPRAACAAACILLVGYIFAILAHYRLIFGGGRRYPKYPQRRETSTAEKVISVVAVLAAIAAFCISYVTTSC